MDKKMSVFSKTSKTLNHNYQPGVDGLRAVAVLLVLIFHVGFDAFPGGFIGVDVFFVISGYLITGILFNQMLKGSFSYVDFILARIARLYPALLFTLAFVFAGCFLLYSPADFADVSRSAIYAIFSATNIFFANSAGYFDTSSEINPLLHTWSLGVEQQFYIVWPILLSLALFKRKQLVTYLLVVVSLVSLLASQWATTHMQTEAYYWMPFRVFELSLGGIAFLISRSTDINKLLKEALMSIGLIMIIVSAATFSSSRQFPGLNALIPVFGSMLCILSHDAKFAGYVVNNKISVAIGIISYSVYLIHWPLIVFYKYWIFREINSLEKTVILALSLIIGFAMYYGIENRFRKIPLKSLSFKQIAFLSTVVFAFTAFYGSANNNGYGWRVHDQRIISELLSNDNKAKLYGGYGVRQQVKVVLGVKNEDPLFVMMGDSYSRQYANAIDEQLNKIGKSAVGFFKDGCFFSSDIILNIKGKIERTCKNVAMKAIDYARENDLPIVFSQSWMNYSDKVAIGNGERLSFKSEKDYAKFNADNINRIQDIYGVKVTVIGNPPPSGAGVVDGSLSCMTRPSYLPKACIDQMSANYDDERREYNSMLKKNLNNKIVFIDPYDFMCTNGKCPSVSDAGAPLYSDGTHLSIYGARYLWGRISALKDF
ncbi:acyltransferase family protein [Enterobacter hormaechei subsp. steigerwaltii]